MFLYGFQPFSGINSTEFSLKFIVVPEKHSESLYLYWLICINRETDPLSQVTGLRDFKRKPSLKTL